LQVEDSPDVERPRTVRLRAMTRGVVLADHA
jgi:hypothetical protein